jgi:hypothetical protein
LLDGPKVGVSLRATVYGKRDADLYQLGSNVPISFNRPLCWSILIGQSLKKEPESAASPTSRLFGSACKSAGLGSSSTSTPFHEYQRAHPHIRFLPADRLLWLPRATAEIWGMNRAPEWMICVPAPRHPTKITISAESAFGAFPLPVGLAKLGRSVTAVLRAECRS